MQQQLPEVADFLRQVARQGCFEGSWPIARLERLKDLLNSDSGQLKATLAFGTSAGTCYLKGTVQAELEVQCQRCLQPMRQPVSGDFMLGLVTSVEAIDALPEPMEPYLVEGEQQSIIAVLEDELLLALPIVSTHEDDCSQYIQVQEKQKQADRQASSPFAALKNLMTD